ncbi:MAG TPA: GGDEF domain-containing protein [Nocardioides sp.]|nr:GGDEF domain-containing protein [Nocardioides sp.]
MEKPGPSGPAAGARRLDREDRRNRLRRPYPLPAIDDGGDGGGGGDTIVLAATRALLRALTREEASAVLRTAVEDLGGRVGPADVASDDTLPLDLSLGVGEPAVVQVAAGSAAYAVLKLHLTGLVDDAHLVANRIDLSQQQARMATVDPLTGAATRREIGLRLGRAEPGDVVCVLDLDGFKLLNDARGHAAGDDALRDLGRLLRSSIRFHDFVGRYGGDEFVMVLTSTDPSSACTRMAAVADEWRALGDHGTTISVGVAPVDEGGGALAAKAADAALYRAKRSGRDRVEPDLAEDYPVTVGRRQ